MRFNLIRVLPVAAVTLGGATCGEKALQGPIDAGHDGRSNPAGWALGPDCVDCTREPVGVPLWQPARAVLFSGNVGAAGESRNVLMQTVLAPRHKFYSVEKELGPAVPHLPPYEDEIYDLFDARGIKPSQAFDDVQFTAPQAVMMMMAVVPAAGAGFAGSSFDFESGPIIPNYMFPIRVDGELYRDGRLFDSNLDTVYVGPDRFTPPLAGDGASHLFVGFGDNGVLARAQPIPPDGSYEYRVSMTDAVGAGWKLRVPFKVGTGGTGGTAPTGKISLVPDATGWLDGSNAAGVRGSWWSTGDFFGTDASPGTGSCPSAGFSAPVCSVLTTPTPGQPFAPEPNGRGMCTSGSVAQVLPGSDGAPAWSAIWGNIIGFSMAWQGDRDSDAGASGNGPYDANAHGVTGFAFDIDNVPLGGHIRVEFATTTTNDSAAYWKGRDMDFSPVFAPGHYEMRWSEIGGPNYLTNPPPFDPTQLNAIRFHVVPNASESIPYSFCIKNTVLLTD
jgi:hypothetical protein